MSIRHEEQREPVRLSELERIGEQIPCGFFVYRADDSQQMLCFDQVLLEANAPGER